MDIFDLEFPDDLISLEILPIIFEIRQLFNQILIIVSGILTSQNQIQEFQEHPMSRKSNSNRLPTVLFSFKKPLRESQRKLHRYKPYFFRNITVAGDNQLLFSEAIPGVAFIR